jgi:hypothetical protein
MSNLSLDDVFNGVEPSEPEAPIEETPTAEPEPEPEAEPVEAKEEEAPAAPEPEPQENWTKAAVLDERRKRQALQAELEQLKNQEPAEVPDIFTDQNAYTDYINQSVSDQVFRARVEMSQEFMRMQDSKYDDKETQFYEMATQNPLLVEQVKAHPMPARFVVDTVNKANELRKLENIDEYKAKLRAEMEADIRKELGAEMESKAKQSERLSSITPSLANARSSNASDKPIDQSLEELFGGR